MNTFPATAVFADIWNGATPCHLEALRTSHKGARVTRFHWVADSRAELRGIRGPRGFTSVAEAIAAACRNSMFSNLVAGA